VRGLCGGFVLTRRSDPHSLGEYDQHLFLISFKYINKFGSFAAPLYEELELPMSNSVDEGSAQYPFNEVFADNVDFPDSEVSTSPWGKSPSKLIALQVLAEGKAHPRFRRNIINECCKRPCTVSHMMKYCGTRT
jgi:hypothetical protein